MAILPERAEPPRNRGARGAIAASEDDQNDDVFRRNFDSGYSAEPTLESPARDSEGGRTSNKIMPTLVASAAAAAAVAAMTATVHTALETRRHRQKRQLRAVCNSGELAELRPTDAAQNCCGHSRSAIGGSLEVGLGESCTSIDVGLSDSTAYSQSVLVHHEIAHNRLTQSLRFEMPPCEPSDAEYLSKKRREAANGSGLRRQATVVDGLQRQTAPPKESLNTNHQQWDVAHHRMQTLEEPVDSSSTASADPAKSGAALGRKKKRVSWQASHDWDKSETRSSSAWDSSGDDSGDCKCSNGIFNVAYDSRDDTFITDSGIGINVGAKEIGEPAVCVTGKEGASCDSPPEYYYAPDRPQLSRLLQELRSRLSGLRSDEFRFLGQLFGNEKFARAISLLNSVEHARAALARRSTLPTAGMQLQDDSTRPTPVAARLSALLCGRSSVSAQGSGGWSGSDRRSSRSSCSTAEEQELRALLQRPHIQHLLMTYDILAKAQESPLPSSIAADDEELYNKAAKYTGKSIRIVHVMKGDGPLGATVKKENENVIIGRIVHGGEAARSGVLREGDELLEVNGLCMQGRTVDEVSNLLATMCGQLTMVISRADCEPVAAAVQRLVSSDSEQPAHSSGTKVAHFRALFDYAPEDDAFLPCKELGLAFNKGDVLQVIDQSDPNWWQAYRVDRQTRRRGSAGGISGDFGRSSRNSWSTWSSSNEPLAGLIPSKSFHHERESHLGRSIRQLSSEEDDVKDRSCLLVSRGMPHRRKRSNVQLASDVPEVRSYVEVAEYLPPTNRRRPVVLVGLPETDRKQIRDLIMLKGGLGQFSVPVPHTTRPCKPTEIEGKDYHFIRRSLFEADVRAEKFVECSQSEGHWYGTTVESVRQIYYSGRTCVLVLHPTSLQVLYQSGLMPFVVYIAMPQVRDHLKMTLLQKTGYTDISNEQLDGIVERTRRMEDEYGHLFDLMLVNGDHHRISDVLLDTIGRLRVLPQWVPTSWLEEAKAIASSHEQRLHAAVDLHGAIWA